MEKITRTVTTTVIQFSEAVVENGTPVFKSYQPEIVADAVDSAQALMYLRKKYGADRSFLVTGLETSTRKYEMDLSVFVKTATPVVEKGTAAAAGQEVGGEAAPNTEPATVEAAPVQASPAAAPTQTAPVVSAASVVAPVPVQPVYAAAPAAVEI